MIDLHTHSTASDGLDSPRLLIQKAKAKGLLALALTDHDTLDGWREAEQEAGEALLFLRGVELEIAWPSGEFHLLGLNLTGDTACLEALLVKQRQFRRERNETIIEKMRGLGMDAEYAAIAELALGGIIGRPHFADYLVRHGKARSIQGAFDKYLAYGRPLFAPKKAISLEEALEAVHAAAGKAIVAHPLSLYLSWGKLPEAIKKMHAAGLDGVEAFHSQNSARESQRLCEIASSFGLFVTCGSDYHGKKRPDRQLGYSSAGQQNRNELIVPLLNSSQLAVWQRLANRA